jgi:flagellin
MGRINTNVLSIISQRVLGNNNKALSQSLERLSTGLRITRGADDPAGLIASENLRNDAKATNQAISNADRADQVSNIAEGGLQEVSGLLNELQGLVTSAANVAGQSVEERQAAQLQVDSILQTVDRISSSTNFQGIKLLNGNLGYRTSSVSTGVADYKINAAKFAGKSLGIDIAVTGSAQQAGLFLSTGGSSLDLSTGSSLTVQITGSRGSRELSFASGTTLARVAAAINTFKDVTGVEAKASGTGVKITSTDWGSAEYVSVKVVKDAGINLTANGDAGTPVRGVYKLQTGNFGASQTTAASTFAVATNGVRDEGQDLIASINGVKATARGKEAWITSDFLDVRVNLTTTQSQQLGNVGGSGSALYVTGGGADFMIDGRVNIGSKVSIGIDDIAVRKLGNSDSGFLNALESGKSSNLIDGDAVAAQKIVAKAIEQVSTLRGRLGTFQKNTIGSTIRNLSVALENTSAAESSIRDANFASETAQLTRSQILVSASTNILGIANNSPQSALQLLG